MIVFRDRKLAIVTPPHTASGNLHRTLCNCPYRAYWMIGFDPGGICSHHVGRLPTGFEDYEVALVVRHPLDRLAGLWRHHCYWSEQVARTPVIPFEAYVRLVAGDRPPLQWIFHTTICDFLEKMDIDQVDQVIRYERLQEEIDALMETHVALPGPYPEHVSDWTSQYSPQLAALAARWGKPDIDRWYFGD